MTVACNRIDLLDLLLEHGADVDERLLEPLTHSAESKPKREEASETPPHRAVKKRATPTVQWLVNHGADTSIQDCLLVGRHLIWLLVMKR
jgi:ankyrin repeat protein